MNSFIYKIVVVLALIWSGVPIQALDSSGIAALQQYSNGASPQIVSTADQLNEQYVIFENLMKILNSKLTALQQGYQTWNDFIESFPSCGNGSLTNDSTGAQTCQNSVFPTLQSYISGTGTSTQLSFMPAIAEIGALAAKASNLLTQISNNTQIISSVMDATTVSQLASNLSSASLRSHASYNNANTCYLNAWKEPNSVLQACYNASPACTGSFCQQPPSNIACSVSSGCENEACCSTAITSALRDYQALFQAEQAFFEEIQKYFPLPNPNFSASPNYINGWFVGCAAPSLCENCGQGSPQCNFSIDSFASFDADIYLNAFLQWVNTANNVTAEATNKLSTYQQDLANFSSDFNSLIANIQSTATQMGTLMSCCQTVVQDYETVLQHWDLAITLVGGLVIGIGEIDAVASVVEALAGEAGNVKGLMMVITAIPPVGNTLVGKIVNLFSMPFAQWAASIGSDPVNFDRSQVLTEPQITDYGSGYSASQSAQN